MTPQNSQKPVRGMIATVNETDCTVLGQSSLHAAWRVKARGRKSTVSRVRNGANGTRPNVCCGFLDWLLDDETGRKMTGLSQLNVWYVMLCYRSWLPVWVRTNDQ